MQRTLAPHVVQLQNRIRITRRTLWLWLLISVSVLGGCHAPRPQGVPLEAWNTIQTSRRAAPPTLASAKGQRVPAATVAKALNRPPAPRFNNRPIARVGYHRATAGSVEGPTEAAAIPNATDFEDKAADIVAAEPLADPMAPPPMPALATVIGTMKAPPVDELEAIEEPVMTPNRLPDELPNAVDPPVTKDPVEETIEELASPTRPLADRAADDIRAPAANATNVSRPRSPAPEVQATPATEPVNLAPPSAAPVSQPISGPAYSDAGAALGGTIVGSAPAVSLGAPEEYLGPAGIDPDRPGIADNIILRIGGSLYTEGDRSEIGPLFIGEASFQIRDSDYFFHGGGAVEYIDGQWPGGFSVGFSKLARISPTGVEKPLILAAAYDGYFDSYFLQTDSPVYNDQIRLLAGYALTNRLDVGVWGAKGLQEGTGDRTTPAGTFQVRSKLSDRVAAYVATDVGRRNAFVLASAGWEDGPGNFFVEGDTFMPLTRSVNSFFGLGYTDAGVWDFAGGFELMLGRNRSVDRGLWGRDAIDGCSCDDYLESPRHRGGWANDTYRGALRTILPARLRRNDPAGGTPPSMPNPPGGGPKDPDDCPPSTLPPTWDECVPRRKERPHEKGLLEKRLEAQGRNPI